MYVDSQTSPALFALLTQLNAQKSSLAGSINVSLAQLNDIATKIGFELFSLGHYDKAELCLTITAAQGNVEAQYAMATCVTKRDGGFRVPSNETRTWLRLAAAQDHIPSLMRLGDAESLKKANDLLIPKANGGDTQAMRLLFKLSGDVSWLDMASTQNDHCAQMQLAQAYDATPALIPNEIERRALIEELRQKAADGGDLNALAERVFSDTSTANIQEKQHRLVQLAETGQLDALLEYGYALAGMPRNGEGYSNFSRRHASAPRTYGLERDLAKAYAVLKLVLPKLSDAPLVEILKQDMSAVWHQMTPQQDSTSEAIWISLQASIPRIFKSMGPMIIVGELH